MLSGIRASICSTLGSCPRTITCGVTMGASSTRCAASRLPKVADNPHTCNGVFERAECAEPAQRANRASASCVCTPRLLPMSSCHSSTTTSRTDANWCLASGRLSSKVRLSGVVTSALGSRRCWRARSAELVSPVRRPMLQSTPSA